MATNGNGILLKIMLIFILTAINAFFASAEMAIVSLNKNRLRMISEDGNKKAILLEKLLEEPSQFLATIQVGITLAGFFASASAAVGISDNLARVLKSINVPYSSQFALIITTVLLSYFTLVLGELYPKRLALQKSEEIAMFSVKPIIAISKAAKPFIRLLSNSTNLLVRISGIKTDNLDEKVSMEEIKSLIEVGQEHGVINATEREMIESIFKFDDKIAREVMTPRTDVFMLDISSTSDIILNKILKQNYSRIPVYETDIDNIIGILYMKDFILEASKNQFKKVDVRKILRDPYFVPASKYIDDLFKELQKSKNHMAVLIDEYGGFEGIVTIEDLIEEIMGDIFDEHDEAVSDIIIINKNTCIVNGLISIDEVNQFLNLNLHSQYSDTIGGFLIDIIGSIPIEGEKKTIEYNNITFIIEKASGKRIEMVKIIKNV